MMSCPPKIAEKDRVVLEIIARGHPDRKITAAQGGVSKQVSALTWNEIQVALNASLSEISDSIAHLVANAFIVSGQQPPSFWGLLRGESETSYFWITPKGQAFLRDGESAQDMTNTDSEGLSSTPEDLQRVEDALKQLGYNITPYGVGVALLSLESGYNYVETASHLAVVTLARDAKEAGQEILKLMALVPHARAMMDILAEFKKAGLMRDEIFKNDGHAIIAMVTPQKEQQTWIARVLSDPVTAKERVAISRFGL